MRRRLPVLIGLVVAIAPAYGDNWAGKCVSVSHGDTITVMPEGKAEKIRLQGIDCPEGKQDFSSEATAFAATLVLLILGPSESWDPGKIARFLSSQE